MINAEEALESPEKSADSDNSPDYQRKFELYNKIGQRDFDDTILFKHHRRKRKKTAMSASVNSLSSSGSDDRDSMYTQPTLMNLSTVGVLPDLRSPESIKNDIEYKEKILANVLNFDKVNVSVEEEKVEEEEEAQAPVSADLIFNLNKNDVKNEEEKKEIINEVLERQTEDESDNKEEFYIKPFKHIFPEFAKIKYEDLKVADTPGKISYFGEFCQPNCLNFFLII